MDSAITGAEIQVTDFVGGGVGMVSISNWARGTSNREVLAFGKAEV